MSFSTLPDELIGVVLGYLVNDSRSIFRCAVSCKLCFRIVSEDERNDALLWKPMHDSKWTRGGGSGGLGLDDKQGYKQNNNKVDDENSGKTKIGPHQELYLHRHELDQRAIRYILEMAHDLRRQSCTCQDDDAVGDSSSLFPIVQHLNQWQYVGQVWAHACWPKLLRLESNIYNVLKSMANAPIDYSSNRFNQNLVRFLAARTLVTIHQIQVLLEWKQITLQVCSARTTGTAAARLDTDGTMQAAIWIEQYSLLACRAQMTPPEILSEEQPEEGKSNITIMEKKVSNELDRIANVCRDGFCKVLGHDFEEDGRFDQANITSRLEIINNILFQELGFGGNRDDYYNYKNSLLHHLVLPGSSSLNKNPTSSSNQRSAIPLTLAVFYQAVCRRLGIAINIIGLPGHVVVGVPATKNNSNTTIGEEHLFFVDVFAGGTVLTLEDCRIICASYGIPWQARFVEQPLTPVQVLDRILNNLAHCHGQASGGRRRRGLRQHFAVRQHQLLFQPFAEILSFQERLLTMLHRDAETSTEHVSPMCRNLPLIISESLLRLYGLLSTPHLC